MSTPTMITVPKAKITWVKSLFEADQYEFKKNGSTKAVQIQSVGSKFMLNKKDHAESISIIEQAIDTIKKQYPRERFADGFLYDGDNPPELSRNHSKFDPDKHAGHCYFNARKYISADNNLAIISMENKLIESEGQIDSSAGMPSIGVNYICRLRLRIKYREKTENKCASVVCSLVALKVVGYAENNQDSPSDWAEELGLSEEQAKEIYAKMKSQASKGTADKGIKSTRGDKFNAYKAQKEGESVESEENEIPF